MSALLCYGASHGDLNSYKLTVAPGGGSGMVWRPVWGAGWRLGGRDPRVNGLKIRRRVGGGGHNNIENNPVFRGMVRR